MNKNKKYTYEWSDYKAVIDYSKVFRSWRWTIYDTSIKEVFATSHMDLKLDTPKEAENDLFYAIYDRLGSTPERQLT